MLKLSLSHRSFHAATHNSLRAVRWSRPDPSNVRHSYTGQHPSPSLAMGRARWRLSFVLPQKQFYLSLLRFTPVLPAPHAASTRLYNRNCVINSDLHEQRRAIDEGGPRPPTNCRSNGRVACNGAGGGPRSASRTSYSSTSPLNCRVNDGDERLTVYSRKEALLCYGWAPWENYGTNTHDRHGTGSRRNVEVLYDFGAVLLLLLRYSTAAPVLLLLPYHCYCDIAAVQLLPNYCQHNTATVFAVLLFRTTSAVLLMPYNLVLYERNTPRRHSDATRSGRSARGRVSAPGRLLF